MELDRLNCVYFIGIGGIGMSALARYFNSLGIEVAGYDRTETTLTKKLVEEGMTIHYEADISQLPQQIDLVVYTPAVPEKMEELVYLRSKGHEPLKRAAVLGLISRSRKTIGVAGTHGKTSTTSILTYLLKVGGVDVTGFLGGIAQNFESNYVAGNGEWVVVEADEFDRSFLHLEPEKAILLSMDADHLDIYGDESTIHAGFQAFVSKIRPGGQLIVRNELPLDQDALTQIEISEYGVDGGTYRAENVSVVDGYFVFDLKSPIQDIDGIKFSFPGRHNIENATAAIAIAQNLGVDAANIKKALASFKGIKRRFETIYRDDQVVYIDDYAHHPSELKAAISAARDLFPDRKITGIFQPHLYSRTRDFVDGFGKSLSALDEILLMDIYPAREEPIPGVTAQIVFDRIDNEAKERVTKDQLMEALKQKEIDVLLTLGAGDIGTFVQPIKTYLESMFKENT